MTAEFPLAKRLELFPRSTRLESRGGQSFLSIAGTSLIELAKQYGTPLYIYDQSTLDDAVQRYRQALADSYPGPSGLTYAGKAFLCLGMAQWTQQQGLWLDCTGIGELGIAAAAGIPRQNILMHGVNKSQADLQAGLAQAGTLVVDNLVELQRLADLARDVTHPLPEIWLRFRPGLAVKTHAFTQTGQDDSKFGLSPAEVVQAVQLCQREGLPLVGLHFHQGSHFHDPDPIGPALDTALDVIIEAHSSTGWMPRTLCPGGGWGVPYHEDDLPHPSLESYVHFVAQRLAAGCQERGLPLPHLQLEPGRSLAAQAGVAVYRVDSVKTTPHRRWLLLDGGLADNPRPALYGARYTALPVEGLERPAIGLAWLAGPFCESGDILIQELPMPEISPGELVAVPVSGAYQLSMGSNYNGARKPAVLWLHEAKISVLQRRETLEDLFRRDLPLKFAS
ncbi:MAG: diaminopimelate decarboxylase [Anaerolineales bacterium]|nr:diaminopimelate decarboxylase [Anaerolineales bacterium]